MAGETSLSFGFAIEIDSRGSALLEQDAFYQQFMVAWAIMGP